MHPKGAQNLVQVINGPKDCSLLNSSASQHCVFGENASHIDLVGSNFPHRLQEQFANCVHAR
jgi:hypothetical protein